MNSNDIFTDLIKNFINCIGLSEDKLDYDTKIGLAVLIRQAIDSLTNYSESPSVLDSICFNVDLSEDDVYLTWYNLALVSINKAFQNIYLSICRNVDDSIDSYDMLWAIIFKYLSTVSNNIWDKDRALKLYYNLLEEISFDKALEEEEEED